MSENPRCYIVTGSLTREGGVAYLRADDTWTTKLEEGQRFASATEAEARLARVKAAEAVITEPYVFEAEDRNGTIRPLSARELLRATGPSTRLRRPDGASPS